MAAAAATSKAGKFNWDVRTGGMVKPLALPVYAVGDAVD
jgi:hypothetical protein